MTKLVSCTRGSYEIRGKVFNRLRFPTTGNDPELNGHCHDCGTPPGGLHHPGCDMEACPNDSCAARGVIDGDRAQVITCGCIGFGDMDGLL
ncbi:MAG: hypothetical protein ACQSGP_08780 [Frankia sp.]